MPLTDKQIRLAVTIDIYVKSVLAKGGGDEDLLMSMYDQMLTFKQLLDTSTDSEMFQLCQQYDGFYRFAKLIDSLGQGIADANISVP